MISTGWLAKVREGIRSHRHMPTLCLEHFYGYLAYAFNTPLLTHILDRTFVFGLSVLEEPPDLRARFARASFRRMAHHIEQTYMAPPLPPDSGLSSFAAFFLGDPPPDPRFLASLGSLNPATALYMAYSCSDSSSLCMSHWKSSIIY
jgi:hypothetical protein